MLVKTKPKKGPVRRFLEMFLSFTLTPRFILGFAVGAVVVWGFTPPPAVCPPLVVQAAPKPPEPVFEGETVLVAPEGAEIQYGPRRKPAPAKKHLVRFDTHGRCVQVKDQTQGIFIPDGCIVYGDTVLNRKRFDRQYARVGADEVRWKAEESASRF